MEDFDYRNGYQINDSGYFDDSMISNDESNLQKSDLNDFLLAPKRESISINTRSTLKSDQAHLGSSADNSNRKISDFISDNIFDPSYKISMNRFANRFSTSRIARKFIYESNGKTNVSILDSKKFCLMKNNQVMTYLVNLYIFSEFVNLSEIEKDDRIKVIFIKKDNSLKKFSSVNDNILNNLNINLDQKTEFDDFIKGVNKFLEDEQFIGIEKDLKKFKFYTYGSTMGLIILLLIIGYFIYFIFTGHLNHNLKMCLIIFITCSASVVLFLLIQHFIKAKKLKLFVIYNLMEYLLINYNDISAFVENWNKKFFENNKIRVYVPVSLNYIMFNLNPYQEIEIKHLDIDFYKKKLYRSKNIVFNDKHLYKFLKTIQNKSRNKGAENVSNNYSIN